MQRRLKRIAALLLCVILLSCTFVIKAENTDDYRSYSQKNSDLRQAKNSFFADMKYSVCENGAYHKEADSENDKVGIYLPDGGSCTVAFRDVEPALYYIMIEYCTVPGNTGLLEYGLMINGEVLFEECNGLRLNHVYSYEKAVKDTEGNEIPPQPIEVNKPMTVCASDPSGRQMQPYLFSISGDTTLTINNLNSDFILLSVALCCVEEPIDYETYSNNFKGMTEAAQKSILIEGEQADFISDLSIAQYCDDSSYKVSPAAWDKKVMNVIGGEGWSTPGESIEWQFVVEQSGFYEIAIRFRQDYTGGLFTNRRLRIDGEVLFSQLEVVTFPYGIGWNETFIGNDEGAYRFYFEKGTHIISLECVLGDMGQYLDMVENALELLNNAYRKVFMLTGSSPDSLRDYDIGKKLPEVTGILEDSLEILKSTTNDMDKNNGMRASDNVIIDDIIIQVERFVDDIETMPSEIGEFQSNLSSLATWINDRYSQPLDLDYILLSPYSDKKEVISGNFFTGIWFGIKKFLRSFSSDYSSTNEANKEIEVWLPTARDTSEIIRNLISERFIPEYEISVKTKLMGGSELAAIVAGRQPDVIVMQASGEPVNYAMRGALLELDEFEDFEDVSHRFSSATLIPFKYNGHTYALPETMGIPVLFYRTDIFEELQLTPPQTWNDIYGIIAVLQANNMQFAGVNFDMLLYQNGGSYYTADGKASAIDSEQAISAFGQWTSLYTDYKLPLTFNFMTRFRSGEMPVAIQDYTVANQISLLAPEINGDWSIAPIPGTILDDGSISNKAVTTSTSCYILKKSKNPDAAWNFLKWWTDADTQLAYTGRLENRLGAVARVAVSNLDALKQIPWSKSIVSVIDNQLGNLTAVENVPGGYFTSRHINNAFRQVVYNNADVRETIHEYIGYINNEITERRKEFGLSTD